MDTDIIVNVGSPRTRVAILEDGRMAELLLEGDQRVVGNVYLGKVENVVPGLDAAFVDVGLERNVFLHVSDAMITEPSRAQMRKKMESFPPIKEVVKPGEQFLVQVTKGPVDAKGARASRRISLPSRNLVLMADGRGKVGISKKIEDDQERARLREIAQKTRPEGFGMIVRTRAEGADRKEFEADVKFLMKLWRSIQAKAKQEKAPALIYEDLTLVFEVLRDVFDSDVRNFVVDDKATYDKVLNLLNGLAPELRSRVKLYKEQEPIFVHYGIEQEIERALRRKVWLPKGGYIGIDATEALTTIDVNTGKFTSTKRLEDTVLRTNLEAAEEIARQLRLRDIGGIIVIDFIDMDNPRHRRQVTAALKTALEADRMKTRIMHITRLGLIEMTRKRTGQSLAKQLQVNCPCCEGTGKILSPEAVGFRIAESLRQASLATPAKAMLVKANPQVAMQLIGERGELVQQTETRLGKSIYIRGVEDMHPETYEILSGDDKAFKSTYLPYRKGQKLVVHKHDLVPSAAEGLVALVEGYIIDIPEAGPGTEMPLTVRLTELERSYAEGAPEGAKGRARPKASKPADEEEDTGPRPIRYDAAPDEREGAPVSYLAAAEEADDEDEFEDVFDEAEDDELESDETAAAESETAADDGSEALVLVGSELEGEAVEEARPAKRRRGRRRRRGRGGKGTAEAAEETPAEGAEAAAAETAPEPAGEAATAETTEAPAETVAETPADAEAAPEAAPKKPRRRGRRRRKSSAATEAAQDTATPADDEAAPAEEAEEQAAEEPRAEVAQEPKAPAAEEAPEPVAAAAPAAEPVEGPKAEPAPAPPAESAPEAEPAAAEEPQPEPVKKPRARRTRKPKAEAVPEPTLFAEEPPAEPAEAPPAVPEPPAPAAEPEPAAEAAEGPGPEAAAEAKPARARKPRKPRATKKTAAEAAEAETPAAEEPAAVVEPAPEPAATAEASEAAPEEAPKPRARRKPRARTKKADAETPAGEEPAGGDTPEAAPESTAEG